MGAMDVDEDNSSQQLVLIRAVRSLDDDSSVTLPDKINKLWLLLVAVKHTRLHGVEENILRWLLKQMGGNNENAEHTRRFPLAWKILGHVFPKVPAQALGRSLAYFRFVSILSKTLEDCTAEHDSLAKQPEMEHSIPTSRKRKRGADSLTTLADLRTRGGCLRTAAEVFEALAILLDQGTAQSGELTAEIRVGAEHVKSLFSSSADCTRDITANMLLICDKSLSLPDGEPLQGQHAWIDTLTSIWNLRLHSKDDSLEFAKYIYERACLVLAKLESDNSTQFPSHVSGTLSAIWIPRLRRLLSTYFIRPARQRFAVDQNIDILSLALQIASKDIIASTTVTWRIVARTPRDISDPKSKVEHDAWIEKVFRELVTVLRPLARPEKNKVLSRLLDIALQTQSIPDTETLTALYRQRVLDGTETDWTLLSKVLACDTEVFLVAQEPGSIFDQVSGVSDDDAKVKNGVVSNVILPLQDAFSKSRDLTGFITHWFRSLCAAQIVEESIWFDPRIREHLATMLQASLSGTQILRLLEILEATSNNSGELLVVLDGICAGLTDETTISSVDSKILSMMDRKWADLPSGVLALKWRIWGYLASWESSDECNEIWKKTKADLKPILKKTSLTAPETFEAFSFGYKLCLSYHISGKYEEDLTRLITTVLGRLISSVDSEVDLQKLKAYIDLTFFYLPRLGEQPNHENNIVIDQIVKLFWRISPTLSLSSDEQRLEYVRQLIHKCDLEGEESLADALLAPILDLLDNSENQGGWTQTHTPGALLVLLEFPTASWTRGRRKRVMVSWKKHKSTIISHAAKDQSYAALVLRLLVHITQRPTFYEDMEFADLIEIASTTPNSNATLLSLVERYVDTTIRHVLTNTNEFVQSYLFQASLYVKELRSGKRPVDYAQVILLKSLATTLADHGSSDDGQVFGTDPIIFRKQLAKSVKSVLSDFSLEANESSTVPMSDTKIQYLSTVLDAGHAVSDEVTKIELSGDTLTRLERASSTMASINASLTWKIRSFLMKQCVERYTAESFGAVLDEIDNGVEEEWIYSIVDVYVQGKSQSIRDQLLDELISRDELIRGSVGPLIAIRRLLELYQGSNRDVPVTDIGGNLDLAKVHGHFALLLSRTESLPHFKRLTETILYLLDKHASAMTQYNIEATLTSIVEVCSAQGPKIQGPKIQGPQAAGDIFTALFKLAALVIKRHRLRLSGHFHLLLATLRALLTVLLADPSPSSTNSPSYRAARAARKHPPWLLTRLQHRHAERFARLLTLVCEPSAASVARSRSRSELDSAVAVAKRAAGQYMYLVLEVYVKLQLEVDVSRDMRKALEVGVFSVLDITSEGSRKILNESLDAGGRAVFRALFSEYRKFGKWKGV